MLALRLCGIGFSQDLIKVVFIYLFTPHSSIQARYVNLTYINVKFESVR